MEDKKNVSLLPAHAEKKFCNRVPAHRQARDVLCWQPAPALFLRHLFFLPCHLPAPSIEMLFHSPENLQSLKCCRHPECQPNLHSQNRALSPPSAFQRVCLYAVARTTGLNYHEPT